MAVNSTMLPLGTPAPDFSLPAADGSGVVSLQDFAPAPALLVAFLCVHCPYVKHVEHVFGELARQYRAKGVAVVGISSNDVDAYPDDAPPFMVEQAGRAGFDFPYLYDEQQEAAKAYQAACTPDFFLFGADRKLAYRGQMDSSRPKLGTEATGEDLRWALDLVLAGEAVPEPHQPSSGCNIKWRPGNEPPLTLLV